MAIVKSFKADVSSVSPPSAQMEELWVVYVCLYAENGATLLLGICNSLPPLQSFSVFSYLIFYKVNLYQLDINFT